jgi:hypothetical protein
LAKKFNIKFYDIKPWVQLFLGIIILGISFFGVKTALQENVVREYKIITEQYTLSTVEEVVSKAEKGETFYVFLGVSTCPDCQKFAKRLDVNVKDKGVDPKSIYYIGFDSVEDFKGFSEGSFERLTKGTEGVPIFRKVVKGQLQAPFNDLSDLGAYLTQ